MDPQDNEQSNERNNDKATRLPAHLDGLRVFVGGPIQYASTDAGFEPTLRDCILTFIDAIRAVGGEVSSAHLTEQFGLRTALFTPDEVAVRDFTWMTECDVFVPVLPADANGLLRTDGTHIELGWASALGRPIVVLTSPRATANASHLLRGLGAVATTTVLDIERVRADPTELLAVLAAVLSPAGRS